MPEHLGPEPILGRLGHDAGGSRYRLLIPTHVDKEWHDPIGAPDVLVCRWCRQRFGSKLGGAVLPTQVVLGPSLLGERPPQQPRGRLLPTGCDGAIERGLRAEGVAQLPAQDPEVDEHTWIDEVQPFSLQQGIDRAEVVLGRLPRHIERRRGGTELLSRHLSRLP